MLVLGETSFLTIDPRTTEGVRKVVVKNECVSCGKQYSNAKYTLPVLPNGEMGYCASCRKEVMQLEDMYGEPAAYHDNMCQNADYNGSINMLEKRYNQWRHVERKLRVICDVIAHINRRK